MGKEKTAESPMVDGGQCEQYRVLVDPVEIVGSPRDILLNLLIRSMHITREAESTTVFGKIREGCGIRKIH